LTVKSRNPDTPSVIAVMRAVPLPLVVATPVALTDATLASDDDQLKVLPAIAAPEAFLAIASSCTCTPSAVTVLIVSGTGVTATVEREESPSGWVESPLHDHVKANTEQKQYERRRRIPSMTALSPETDEWWLLPDDLHGDRGVALGPPPNSMRFRR
jgi:hypothetical protein